MRYSTQDLASGDIGRISRGLGSLPNSTTWAKSPHRDTRETSLFTQSQLLLENVPYMQDQSTVINNLESLFKGLTGATLGFMEDSDLNMVSDDVIDTVAAMGGPKVTRSDLQGMASIGSGSGLSTMDSGGGVHVGGVGEPWLSLADCESGNWINGGESFERDSRRWDWGADLSKLPPWGKTTVRNGRRDARFHGGLQFHPDTWNWVAPMVGLGHIQYAYQATPEEQVTVAIKTQELQGWGAWPVCSVKVNAARLAREAAQANANAPSGIEYERFRLGPPVTGKDDYHSRDVPNTKRGYIAVRRLGFNGVIHSWAPRGNNHRYGLAIDVMVGAGGRAGEVGEKSRRDGRRVSDFFIHNSSALNVEYVIWHDFQRKTDIIAHRSRNWTWRPQSGTAHNDHPHIQFDP